MKKFCFAILFLVVCNVYFSQNSKTIRVVKEEKEYKFDTTIVSSSYTNKTDLQGAYVLYSQKPSKSNKNTQIIKELANIYIQFDTIYFINNSKLMKKLIRKKIKGKKLKKLNLEKFPRVGFEAFTKIIETSKSHYTISKNEERLDSVSSSFTYHEFLIVNRDTIWAGNAHPDKFFVDNDGYSLIISEISSISFFNYHNKNFKSSKKIIINDSNYYEYLSFDFKDLTSSIKYFKSYSKLFDNNIKDIEVYNIKKTNLKNVFELTDNNSIIAKIRLINNKIIVLEKSSHCTIENNIFKISNHKVIR